MALLELDSEPFNFARMHRQTPRLMLPSRISIICKVDGVPSPNLMVNVTVNVTCKNDFRFIFGPSDASGSVVVTREELLSEAEKDRQFFLMDYSHPEQDFSGKIRVCVESGESIKWAFDAYGVFKNHYKFSENYMDNLKCTAKFLRNIGDAELSVSVRLEGEQCEVETVNLRTAPEALESIESI
jgi:hypothetical protein